MFYIERKVSTMAMQRFMGYFSNGKEELHTFQVYDHDKMMVRLAWKPYTPEDKREVYSLSKSFCSTAIGMLIDDGVLHLDDRIVDLFPESAPEHICENLAKLRLRHVLSMNTGHAKCVMSEMIYADDAPRAFMAQEFPFEPGTHFAYNTGASCLLSCLVTRKTGKQLVDFLTERLFIPMEIKAVQWNRIKSGPNEGGTGLHVSSDDIIKLGLLYLHKGVWKGKRLLSEAWVEQATSPVSDNSTNGTPDWQSGYGFQFWCNAREGFRGDGACGQLCVVLPERQMVIAAQAELNDMQREMDAVMELVEHLYDEDPYRLEWPICCYYARDTFALPDRSMEFSCWRLDPNPMGWTLLEILDIDVYGILTLAVSDGCTQEEIHARAHAWVLNDIVATQFKPKLVDIMPSLVPEHCIFVASFVREGNDITFYLRYLNCPNSVQMHMHIDGDQMEILLTPVWRFHEGARRLTATRCDSAGRADK